MKSSMPAPGVRAKSRGIITLEDKRVFDGLIFIFSFKSMATKQNERKSNNCGHQPAHVVDHCTLIFGKLIDFSLNFWIVFFFPQPFLRCYKMNFLLGLSAEDINVILWPNNMK